MNTPNPMMDSARRIAGVIVAVLAVGLALIAVGLSGCKHADKGNPATVVAPAGDQAGKLGDQARKVTPAANANANAAQGALDAKTDEVLSKAAAEFHAILDSAEAITHPDDANAKQAVKDSAQQGAKVIGREPTPADKLAALERAHANLKGDFARARALYAQASDAAVKAAAERDAAVLARDQMAQARDIAIAEQARTAEAAAREAADLKKQTQARFDALEGRVLDAEKRAAEAEDKARKEALTLLGWVELGLGAFFILLGGGTAWVTKGAEWQRALIAGMIAAFCFACYWTQHQPWFKWFVIIGASLVLVIGVALWLFRERRAALERRLKEEALEEAERIRNAGKKIVAQIDEWKSDAGDSAKTLLERLRDVMDDDEKVIVHDLRHETAVERKAP